MRSLYLVVLVLVLMAAQGCKSKQYPPYSPEFKFLSKEADGLYNIRSSGFGTGSEATVSDAQKNVFYHIIFKGIPGTDLNVPMVENEADAMAKHKEYFKKFFEEGRYRDFMLSSTLSSNMVNVNGGLQVLADVKVNCNSLRKDLEQNQVIRKFGF